MRRTATFLLACLASPAMAADGEGGFAVDGIGTRSCAEFLEHYPEQDRYAAAYASWLDGFVSAANAMQPETFDLTPWQTVELLLAQLEGYCTSNPDAPWMEGVGALLSALAPGRLTASDEVVQLRVDGRAVLVYREVLARVETRLAAAGYEVAEPENGGDALSLALREFQTAQGLPATGLPDQPTLLRLFQ